MRFLTVMALPAPALLIDRLSRASTQEMERLARDKFPNPSLWGQVCADNILMSSLEERARFTREDGCSDVELIFWAIQEAESPDLMHAMLSSNFKARNPSHLNITRPPLGALAHPPPRALPPRVLPPSQP